MPPSAALFRSVPVPPLLTVSVNRCTLKVAVTDRDAFMVTVQVSPETPSQPLQLPKVDPPLALAVRSEERRVGKEAGSGGPPLLQPTKEVTVLVPVPTVLTLGVVRGTL